MGSLVLYAESMTEDPISWESMNWLVGMMYRWTQAGWPGCEIDAWLTDEWTEHAVRVSLMVLLDRPLKFRGPYN